MNSKQDIDNNTDLNISAPHLSKMKNSNPFKADEDYFESFTSKLQHAITNVEELKNEAPVLANIPKYNPFEVPADYFDYLPGRVQHTIIKSKSTVSLSEWLHLLIKPRFVLPFLVTVLISFSGIKYMNSISTLPQNEISEEITTEEQLLNIDETTLIESVSIGETNDNIRASNEETSIQNYLIENNIDENNL